MTSERFQGEIVKSPSNYFKNIEPKDAYEEAILIQENYGLTANTVQWDNKNFLAYLEKNEPQVHKDFLYLKELNLKHEKSLDHNRSDAVIENDAKKKSSIDADKSKLEQDAQKLLKANGYSINNGKEFDFSNEEIKSFVLTNTSKSLQEKWSSLENQYYEIDNKISPNKLNEVTESLVKNKLEFDRAFSSDMNSNRIVTLLQSDKELLRHAVDYLQQSKMYALLASAKTELADVRIKNAGRESERESILKNKISDLENRVALPSKATLEKVNAKVHSPANVRATANALQNARGKENVQVKTNVKEPIRTAPKKTRSTSAERTR